MCGGYITNYLLEKSRTVAHSEGERSFHIFYQLCAGVNDAQRKRLFLQGKDTKSFRYTSNGLTRVPGINDEEDFKETMSAMSVIGISEEDQDEVGVTDCAVPSVWCAVLRTRACYCSWYPLHH